MKRYLMRYVGTFEYATGAKLLWTPGQTYEVGEDEKNLLLALNNDKDKWEIVEEQGSAPTSPTTPSTPPSSVPTPSSGDIIYKNPTLLVGHSSDTTRSEPIVANPPSEVRGED